MPTSPVSIIDFHGFLDNVVPYSPEAPDNLGEGLTMTDNSFELRSLYSQAPT